MEDAEKEVNTYEEQLREVYSYKMFLDSVLNPSKSAAMWLIYVLATLILVVCLAIRQQRVLMNIPTNKVPPIPDEIALRLSLTRGDREPVVDKVPFTVVEKVGRPQFAGCVFTDFFPNFYTATCV